jgi:predicted Zn-dependent peptidase
MTTLPNGVRVVSETVGHVQSVSIGLWVDAGSVDEPAPVRGISHFIEHMLFKGTEKRSAQQIAEEIESRGGSLNAFTDKECTCFYAKALAEDAGVAMDVLSDMVLDSRLDPDDLALEQNVVIEEIKRHEDTPDETIHDIFAQTLWTRHPLGRPVLGTAKTVSELDQGAVRGYMGGHYTPDRMVLAAAGNVPHGDLVDLASRMLGARAPQVCGRRERAAQRCAQGRPERLAQRARVLQQALRHRRRPARRDPG